MAAGKLIERVVFDEPVSEPDGQGGAVDGWSPRFTYSAHYRRLRGSEAVQAARLAGRQPTVITIRASRESEQITPAWRCRDARTGEAFAIRGITRTEDRAFYEILAESGVAT